MGTTTTVTIRMRLPKICNSCRCIHVLVPSNARWWPDFKAHLWECFCGSTLCYRQGDNYEARKLPPDEYIQLG